MEHIVSPPNGEPKTSGRSGPPGSRRAAAARRQRIVRWAMGTGMFVSFTLTIAVLVYMDRHQPRPSAVTAQVRGAKAATPERPPRPAKSRLVYPYSIVPGGVRSPLEVTNAMRRDPVVADHYVQVVPANLREQQIQTAQLVHASYRIGDKVFWTKRKLVLHPGERVLTDGSTMIRERCGNLLTMEPLAPAVPALEDEPEPTEFDVPVKPYATTGAMSSAAGGVNTFGTRAGGPYAILPPPPGGFPGGGARPTGTGDPDLTPLSIVPPPPPPPSVRNPVDDPNDPDDPDDPTVTPLETPNPLVPVPEPGTFVLVGIGVTAGLIRYARSRRAS